MRQEAEVLALLDKYAPKTSGVQLLRRQVLRVRQAIVRTHPKRLPYPPAHVVKAMHDTYLEVGTMRAASKLFDRTPCTLARMFRRRGLFVNGARKVQAFEFNGERFGKMGRNWRRLTWPRVTLQRVVYEHHHGALPDKMSVQFKNGDRGDFSKDNLVAVTRAEAMLAARAKRLPRRGSHKKAA